MYFCNEGSEDAWEVDCRSGRICPGEPRQPAKLPGCCVLVGRGGEAYASGSLNLTNLIDVGGWQHGAADPTCTGMAVCPPVLTRISTGQRCALDEHLSQSSLGWSATEYLTTAMGPAGERTRAARAVVPPRQPVCHVGTGRCRGRRGAVRPSGPRCPMWSRHVGSAASHAHAHG